MRPWPVTYESGHGPVLLVYYTAFYLPAALLGKLAGGSWNVASQGLALTMFSGIVLAGAWLVICWETADSSAPVRGAGLVAVAVFFGFSGLDVLGKALVNLWYGLPWNFGDWSGHRMVGAIRAVSVQRRVAFLGAAARARRMAAARARARRLVRRAGTGRGAAWLYYRALALLWSPLAAAWDCCRSSLA